MKDAREEHRQAIYWLNEHTDESIEFYLIRIELWQIANSPFAPKFEIVSKPNDWTKAVRGSTDTLDLTDTKIKQLEFWNRFKDYTKQRQTQLRLQKSYPQHWTNISIGSSDAYISLTIHSRERMFGTELYIPDSKELYKKLFEQKEEIESELGLADGQLIWMELPTKKASRIRLLTKGAFEDQDHWEDYFELLLNDAEKFRRVFGKHIKNL